MMNKEYFKGYFEMQCYAIIAEEYPLVSYTNKSEPGAGSPCNRTARIAKDNTFSVRRYQFKRNGDIVVYCDNITLKFWKDRSQNNDL